MNGFRVFDLISPSVVINFSFPDPQVFVVGAQLHDAFITPHDLTPLFLPTSSFSGPCESFGFVLWLQFESLSHRSVRELVFMANSIHCGAADGDWSLGNGVGDIFC